MTQASLTQNGAPLPPLSDREIAGLAALRAEPAGDSLPAIANPMHQGLDGLTRPAIIGGQAALVKSFYQGIFLPHGFAGAVEATRAAAALGVTPDLLGADDVSQTMGFVRLGEDWRPAGLIDMLDPEIFSAVLAAKKRFHEGATLSGAIPLREEFARLLEEIRRHPVLVPPVTIRMGWDQITDWVERIIEACETPMQPGACHGENALSNIMIGPEKSVQLIDFDRATMGDIWRDLGAMAQEICADDEDREAFIAAYTGAPATAPQMARLKLYGMLDDALWAMQLMLGEVFPERQGPELYKYAANRLVRLRTQISANDMARLLREAQA
ncbi:phosphotransferase (plasmid) [Thioclava sp. 'Guangxiensis']|uniref:phosphotransferase family protein n=1 Tax=Thioclava sp. 'Guangxiensis' TaxID=3149044 RepID=UPI003877F4FF